MCVRRVKKIDHKPDLNNLETDNNAEKVSWVAKFGHIDVILLALGFSAGVVYIIVRTYNSVTTLDISVHQTKDEDKQNVLWGVAQIMAIVFLGILTTVLLAIAHELRTTSPTHDVQRTLKVLSFCKTCDILMLVVDLVAFVIGYPDTEMCELFLGFIAPLGAVLLLIEIAEASHKLGIKDDVKRWLRENGYGFA